MECIAIYEKEKEQLMQLLGSLPGRIGLTLSLWTSRQTLGYMCLRGHFIDEDWKVHSRMLNFMNVSSPHTEMALSDAIGACLSDWNMKTRLFTVTNHWNTTYLMLMGALELKHVFASLELSEANYNEAPSLDDWKKVEIVCTYLRLLHDSAKLVSTTDHPTANIYFHEAWKIHYELSNAAAAEENLATLPVPPPPPSPPPEVNTVTTTMENHQENHDDNMIIDNINDNGKVDNNAASATEAGGVAEVVGTETHVPDGMVTEALPEPEPAPPAIPPPSTPQPPPAPASLQLLTSSDGIMDIFEIYVSETTLAHQTKW
ncbi:hypothetical protein QJS10_CPA05g01572 [Acorus calamus]|uniref:Uncharacterized protein n=1 Tax=Acorus calamus TaxID=4465 RepID=A0AAV9ESJ8_ACOCL|nr:hypothetical protein QJS10_CPA05g01572 [Acorus calamus]